MTYYDQLGLLPTARAEEIRKAHRILSKLLHPDQQTDPALRSAAEVQMRLVNAIADILLDPERRRQYDKSLTRPKPLPHRGVSGRIRFKGSSLALVSTILAAVVISIGAVWFFAGDLIYFPASAAYLPPATSSARPHSALPIAGATSAPIPVTATPPLDGLWVFESASFSPPQTRMVLDAAEHVELRLESRGNKLYGKYIARYGVPYHTVSPRVAFRFQGPFDPRGEFQWRTLDGTQGLIDLKLVNDHSMRADWRVVRFGSRVGLGAGAAILTRMQ